MEAVSRQIAVNHHAIFHQEYMQSLTKLVVWAGLEPSQRTANKRYERTRGGGEGVLATAAVATSVVRVSEIKKRAQSLFEKLIYAGQAGTSLLEKG